MSERTDAEKAAIEQATRAMLAEGKDLTKARGSRPAVPEVVALRERSGVADLTVEERDAVAGKMLGERAADEAPAAGETGGRPAPEPQPPAAPEKCTHPGLRPKHLPTGLYREDGHDVTVHTTGEWLQAREAGYRALSEYDEATALRIHRMHRNGGNVSSRKPAQEV